MKKTLSIVLALVLALSLSAFAFADVTFDNGKITGGTAKQDISVGATYVAPEAADVVHVYAVDLSWTVTALTYKQGQTTYTWNVDSGSDGYLTYTSNEAPGNWTEGKVDITITNKSDNAVKATPSYADGEDSVTTTATYADKDGNSITSITVDSAAKDIVNYSGSGAVQTGKIVVTVAANAGQSISADVGSVGTITITLATV